MISSSEVLIAGVTRDQRTYILDLTGAVRRRADMLVKGFPGLYHNQADDTVLAFGGGTVRMLADTEIYSLTCDKWEMLPYKMKYPRASFTPCEYHSVLYLVGGFTSQIESFSLKTRTFSVMITTTVK